LQRHSNSKHKAEASEPEKPSQKSAQFKAIVAEMKEEDLPGVRALNN